jgi:undecaprenyl-diphosphatase
MKLLSFEEKYRKMWLFLIIGTIPAVVFALLFRDFIVAAFSSFLLIGICYFFTGFVLLLTKNLKPYAKLNWKNSLIIGLFQMLALFPGVSRSGMTISAGLFSGIKKEEAVKFTFLLFIPIALAAFIAEFQQVYFSLSLLVSFAACFVLSLVFLNVLMAIVRRGYFWFFSFYCFIIGLVSVFLHFS